MCSEYLLGEGGAVEIVQKIAMGSCKKLGESVSRCLLFLVEQKVHFVRDKYFCDKKTFYVKCRLDF